ncbi:MAG: DVU_1556 family methyltransferase [Desulfomonilaceae bacterium]
MSKGGICTVYEHIAGTNLAVDGIRPGGLELTERALARCQFPQGSRILDVGCGTGVTLDRLTRVHEWLAIGLDASPALLARCRMRNPDLLIVQAAGENLPFFDRCADGVLAECSLSAMSESDRVLDEFRRVLKIGGKLILSDVYARNTNCIDQLLHVPANCCLRGAVSQEQLMEGLTDRGFRIDLWEDHSDLLTKFAVQLVFSYGSMNRFWLQTGSQSIDPNNIQQAVFEAKPGYYLLVAQKIPGEETISKDDSP